MRGVSMAMETIVYLILAVTVLTVLMFFFTSQAGPAQNRIQMMNDQQEGCTAYAKQTTPCAGDSFPLATKLLNACKGLNQFNECRTGSGEACFKVCCRIYGC